ncbi:MAG: guanylate kinase [Peptoniphilaceae bacterium]|nr:guanylate kinase [Peptoniphilaceae bacterium]MDY5765516.1 guanylate kinase [Peptoniphilaceae bacterium]
MGKIGHLIVISGPSGVGKGTVCAELMRIRPDLRLSISATTRAKRPAEVEGENYFFRSLNEFNQLIDEGKLIEFAKVHGNYYGTPKDFVVEQIQSGQDVILEIDVQGAMQVKQNMANGVFIFLLPPHRCDLEQRIRQRGTEEEEAIRVRMGNAKKEIAMLIDYDYAVINDQVDDCARTISHIIDAENRRINRNLLEEYWEEFHD